MPAMMGIVPKRNHEQPKSQHSQPLLLLLRLLPLRQIARLDDLRPRRLIPIPHPNTRHEHGDLLPILLVLGVLARRDELSEPRRTLEQRNETARTEETPVIEGVGGEASPLIEHEPDGLLGEEVGVTAVGEEAGGVEAALEFGLGVAVADFAVGPVRVLCVLVT